jgi:CubicO group peptidase (beta-lactamase class C family)
MPVNARDSTTGGHRLNIDIDLGPQGKVQGQYEPAFEAVAGAFIDNFRQRGEVGASVCLRLGGYTQVDLWGGQRDLRSAAPWQRDTVSVVFSCTKAATALCAQLLVDRGQLDLDAPIARYWPDFAQAGKHGATVLMALNHSLGLPALRAPLKPGAYYDWDYMVDRLAREEPFWTPGSANGYHMISFGWLVGEVVRRVSGRSLGRFFRDEVAEPLGLDFWIGLPVDVEPRIAPIIPFVPSAATPQTEFVVKLMNDAKSIQHLAVMNSGGHTGKADSRAAHAAEIGGGGGVANARSLAGMFEPLASGGKSNGVQLLSAQRIDAMRRVSMQTERDLTLLIPTRFAQGFMLNMDNVGLPIGHSVRIGEQAFGHVGKGGSIGFADVQHGLSFGYTMNRLGGGILLNERGQSLVDAAYASLNKG